LFGTFRLAGIAQQIYYRFFHGQTTNPKAQFMGIVVHVLDARCKELLA
jgi:aminoglycoside phosphotransferase (APT) family kinase protein